MKARGQGGRIYRPGQHRLTEDVLQETRCPREQFRRGRRHGGEQPPFSILTRLRLLYGAGDVQINGSNLVLATDTKMG